MLAVVINKKALREDDYPAVGDYDIMDVILCPLWVLEYLRYRGLNYGHKTRVKDDGRHFIFEQG
jgi:hypothetical protein